MKSCYVTELDLQKYQVFQNDLFVEFLLGHFPRMIQYLRQQLPSLLANESIISRGKHRDQLSTPKQSCGI